MRFSRLLLLPIAALASFAQSAIAGVVLDPTGAAVPGATIRATLEATGAVRTVDTAADGRYRIPSLTIGEYTVECESRDSSAHRFRMFILASIRRCRRRFR
jgi:hypothetical protein